MNSINTHGSGLAARKQDQDLLLTESQVQERYGLKVGTLRAWRVRGTVKLPFVKIGSMVRYRVRDLDAFLADNSHFHTTEVEAAK